MNKFVETKKEDKGLPVYPYIAFRGIKSNSIQRDAKGVRREGYVEGRILYSPALKDSQPHFDYLLSKKGYSFVSHNLQPDHALYAYAQELAARDARAAQMYAGRVESK